MPRPSWDRPKPVEVRKERLAINMWDLSHLHPTMKVGFLGGKIDPTQPIWIDRDKPDETILEFVCNLFSAAVACDLLRSECRRSKEASVRVYLKRAEAWSRLPSTAILTVLEGKRFVLNPEWFPRKVKLIPIAPLPPEKFDWKKFK